MFERFTQGARAVVKGAVVHAGRLGADAVDEGHLLLALFDQEGTRGSFALASLGAADRRESVERALEEARRRGGMSRADSDALAGLGIDLTEIVSRVEEAHGVGAMAGVGAGAGVGGAKGRGRWGGGVPFSREAKDTLSASLRMAIGRRHRSIGDEHLLLALASRGGVVAEILADHGVTVASVDRVLHGTPGEGRAAS
ncbi:Clp protease N-terminal domain-containing protein [Streptomyces sp. NPDC091292]|uniref:Clp protease N-terminal domain-containing protein n=1 Tax=Streptomyces sp. NPDC091292 TaxID=3365991 RepID=UPI00380C79B3